MCMCMYVAKWTGMGMGNGHDKPDEDGESQVGAGADIWQRTKDHNLALATKKFNTCELVFDAMHATEHLCLGLRCRSRKLAKIRAVY